MHMVAPQYWTAEMVRALPDDGLRYETVYGELLVSPAPRPWHQLVLWRLVMALGAYLERERVGQLFFAPADISWSTDTLVQPDCFVVDLEQARTLEWEQMQRLLVAVEVLSPSSLTADRFNKRVLYQRQQIGTYWVIDADVGTVETWTPDATFPLFASERLDWYPDGASVPFSMTLAELFRPM